MGIAFLSMNGSYDDYMDEEFDYSFLRTNMTSVNPYGSQRIQQYISLSFILLQCLFACIFKLTLIQGLFLLCLGIVLYQTHNAIKNIFFPSYKSSYSYNSIYDEDSDQTNDSIRFQSSSRDNRSPLLSTKHDGGLAILSHVDDALTTNSLRDIKHRFQRFMDEKKKI